MAKYKAIAVIYGSDSSEWEVSCRSGEYTASCIDGNRYDVYEIFARFGVWQLVAFKKKDAMKVTFPEAARPQIDKTDFSVTVLGEKVKFDFAYIMQHGVPGENGRLQGYFEMLGIPFSSCSAFVASVAFDKYACKRYIAGTGVKMAEDRLIHKFDNLEQACADVRDNFSFPVFVKPTSGGSSFGVSMVKEASELLNAVKYAFKEDNALIVEQGVHGRELTCAAYFDGQSVKALPPIEIISDNEYFDYDAKYNGHSQEICPAPITEEQTALLQQTTCRIYSHLGCSGIVRMDYILSDDGLFFLEANIIPGMTSASLVPKMVRTAGMNMTDFLTTVIEAC
ncbi:MAG: D-alanine--D-alanine ligase [Bacteroidales bacterium]|nr:D-alanine--D-alanine ligase [Bacteroidales bacterium]